jgi:hypothetical protein
VDICVGECLCGSLWLYVCECVMSVCEGVCVCG